VSEKRAISENGTGAPSIEAFRPGARNRLLSTIGRIIAALPSRPNLAPGVRFSR